MSQRHVNFAAAWDKALAERSDIFGDRRPELYSMVTAPPARMPAGEPEQRD